jgi:hypothetical protein
MARLVRPGLAPPDSGTRLSTLSPSLLEDLGRFAKSGNQTELLEVLAACVRHVRPLTIILEHQQSALQLLLYPQHGVFVCGVDLCELEPRAMKALRVTHIEPILTPPPLNTIGQGSLNLLLWRFALHGARGELLPEIGGRARYRVSPALALDESMADRGLLKLLPALRNTPFSLHELATKPGFSLERAQRLLNAVYLQAGLIVSRVHDQPRHFSMRSWVRC